jgi:hypothetical protein
MTGSAALQSSALQQSVDKAMVLRYEAPNSMADKEQWFHFHRNLDEYWLRGDIQWNKRQGVVAVRHLNIRRLHAWMPDAAQEWRGRQSIGQQLWSEGAKPFDRTGKQASTEGGFGAVSSFPVRAAVGRIRVFRNSGCAAGQLERQLYG